MREVVVVWCPSKGTYREQQLRNIQFNRTRRMHTIPYTQESDNIIIGVNLSLDSDAISFHGLIPIGYMVFFLL